MEDVDVCGIDISKTAIARAKERFPEVRFIVADIVRDDISSFKETFDLVMEKELLWYVLEHLDAFFFNMALMSRRYIYISQSFPEKEHFLGSDIFPNAAALEDYVSRRFRIIYSCTECDSMYGGRELIHILAEKC